jgi:prepilin-type N-terminal cleavage/methylation domain-containing protein/prepilin-type processing-associated H-X9-DG protein
LRRPAFTLVELLVVIGVIALLMAILLPALGRAREAARTVKCGANLHSIGQGMMAYVTDYNGVLPASNFWKKLQILPYTQLPSTPIYGTVHWSSYLYNRGDQSGGTDNIYRSLAGWSAFFCPSLPSGGLPPANTFPGNSSLPNEAAGNIDPDTGQPVIDAQAPRLSYTVNEALCPRGFFVQGAVVVGSQIQRPYRFVRVGSVSNQGATILATELWGVQSVMEIDSLVNPGQGTWVSAARRPVSGFKSGLQGPEYLWQLPNPGGQWAYLFPLNQVAVTDLSPDPTTSAGPGSSPNTTLDWVGRNHGNRGMSGAFDLRRTNFLYLDGHVETKGIKDTLTPAFEWGEQFYSLTGGETVTP